MLVILSATKKPASLLPLRRCALSLLALLIALPLGCAKAAEEEKPPPATVKWEPALTSALEEWTEFVGTSVPLPDRVARISTPIEGRVVSVLGGSNDKPVTEGQKVERGFVLAQLDTTIVKANLAKLEATQEVLQEEQKQAQLALELTTSELDRLEKLQEADVRRAREPGSGVYVPIVSAVELYKAAVAKKDAQSKLSAAKGRLSAGGKEVEALKEQLKLYTLTSPISGRLGRIQVAPGQALSVGAAIADVIDIDEQIDVLCYVPPSMIGQFKQGLPARTGTADVNPVGEAEGTVEYIAEQAEPETGNFAVKVRFNNKEKHLRANSVIRICVQLKPGKECLSLPESAIQEDEIPPSVVVVTEVKTVKNAEGKEEILGVARRLQVTLGLRARNLHQVEIVDLQDTEKDPTKKWQGEVKDALFIVEGAQGLQTGDIVKLEVEGD